MLDKPVLEQLGLDENSEVEVSTNGDVLVMTPLRSAARCRWMNNTRAFFAGLQSD